MRHQVGAFYFPIRACRHALHCDLLPSTFNTRLLHQTAVEFAFWQTWIPWTSLGRWRA